MTHDKLTHRVVLMVAMLVWLAGGTARGQAHRVAQFGELRGQPAGGKLFAQRARGPLADLTGQVGGMSQRIFRDKAAIALRVQPFTFNRLGQPLVGMNVIATKPGLPDYGAVYVGAHYDTVGIAPGFLGGPGAIDNASGVGVMLEGARVAATAVYTPTLHFIAFGAEEDYLIGSGRYVAQLSGRERVAAVGMLNLDCVGWGDEFRLLVAREQDRAFAERLGVGADWLGSERWGASDHLSFAIVGIPAAFFNILRDDLVCGPGYHQQGDTAGLLELPALQRAGDALLTALASLSAQAAPIHDIYLPLALSPPAAPSHRQLTIDNQQLTINN